MDAIVHEAAGRVLCGGFAGRTLDPHFAALAHKGMVGGAILFSRNFEDVHGARGLVRMLRELKTPEPLLLAVDQEGGRVQRLRAPFPELPPMRRLGEIGRKTLALKAGELLADALMALGFHQDYAPVLDVDSNPANPVIGDRSFSNDPSKVARLGAAFIEGLQSRGIAGCGKHFPGHGDTHQDSHHELPRLAHGRERLDQVELFPFRAAVRAEVAAIMTAHIVFEALDPSVPATLSEHVLEPILRRELGYQGVIVSDDLEMRAIADNYGIEDAAVRAIRAGCDQLLICHQPALIESAHGALVRAVQTGNLAKARLLEAASRVQALKERYVFRAPPPPEGPLEAILPLAEHRALLESLAQIPLG